MIILAYFLKENTVGLYYVEYDFAKIQFDMQKYMVIQYS